MKVTYEHYSQHFDVIAFLLARKQPLRWCSLADDIMNAVQAMRARAEQAGNLKSNDQVRVETQGQTIVIEPIDPEVVYVPAYDPWLVYGPRVCDVA
jgi:hypothetical protein